MPPMNLLRICPLTLATLAALMAAEPAPAVITKLNDKGEPGTAFEEAFVTSETVDGLEFLVEDPKEGNKLTLKRGTYRIDYDRTKDIDFLRGDGQEDPAKAIAFFEKAVAANRFQWAKEDSLVALARLNLAAKAYDAVIAAADQLAKDAPRSLRLDDILVLKGQAQQAKGDAAGAKATYAALGGMAKEWGAESALQGTLGAAALLADEKKFAEAAALVEPLLKGPLEEDQFGSLALRVAQYHQAAGKADAALAILAKAAYAPGSAAAEAHLRWARILADRPGSLADAFDHAAIAATLKGAPGPVTDQARALVRTLVDKLQKDPALTDQQKLEYRQCRDNL
jgi:hypothetical protein